MKRPEKPVLRIRKIREAQGISGTTLAENVGMTTQALWNLENGLTGRTYEKLPRIARALNCRIDDLFPEMDGYGPGSVNGDEGLDDLDL